MNEFRLSNKALVMVAGSSKGTQPKYFENGWWYKQNINGYEGEAEYLSSLVLSCSDVEAYVKYERCMINGRSGCRSKSFLAPNEMFFSYERLHVMTYGTHLEDVIRQYQDCLSRIAYVKEFLLHEFGVDCQKYLSQILTLDALTLNCDRHFNNLGIIINSDTGECSPAPIFDNGDSLMSDFGKFHEDTFEANLEHVYARPFSASHIRQALDVGIGFQLDYEKLHALLEKEADSRAIDVLRRQLERYRGIIPDFQSDKE